MRAGIAFLVAVLFGVVQNSEAGDAWSILANPPVYLTFPVFRYTDQCANNGLDVSLDYRRAIYAFSSEMYRRISVGSHYHTVNSQRSMWMMLAAMAEGTEGPAQKELFKVLNLPEDKCQRQQFYQLASSTELNGPDATLLRTRVFAYDEGLKLNQYWKNYINANCLMNTLPVPMRRDPIAAELVMKDLISTRLSTAFAGNSAMLDSLDYQGLWTSAFTEVIQNSPFYNDIGQHIGTVDLMKIKKRVRIAYIPDVRMKVLELPVGINGRYRMMIGLSDSAKETVDTFKNTIVFDLLNRLRTSRIPIEIAIPRFTMTSEFDARPFLEGMGVRSLWNDVYATRNISDPAAKPSSLLQRVTVTFDTAGVNPNTEDLDSFLPINSYDSDTGLDSNIGRDFIVNKPFLFGLLDTKVNTLLFASAFSRPTNAFVLKK